MVTKKKPPLVVDLDGTLLKVDSLYELIAFALRTDWTNGFRIVAAAFRGRPFLKKYLGHFAPTVLPLVPTNAAVTELIEKARQDGRPVVLATASGEVTAAEAARAHGPFDDVIASSDTVNLKGHAKADRLAQLFGERGFDYAGNESADLPIFAKAQHAVLVGGGQPLARRVIRANPNFTHLPGEQKHSKSLARLVRPHQWSKNLLVFVPAMGAQAFAPHTLLALVVSVLCFSAVASAFYVLNDVLDVHADRTHLTKRSRPLARGDVSVPAALALALSLALAGFVTSTLLNPLFAAVLAAYAALTFFYSLVLKRVVVVDVFALSSLYILRLVGGAVVAGVVLSAWLMSFSFFVFLFLALAKRFVEITDETLKDGQSVRGRGYLPSDSNLVGWAGVSVGVVSSMLLALYIEDRSDGGASGSVSWLWATVPLWLYWVLRTWFKAFRSELDDDPVLYALRDRVSLAVGVVLVMILVLAS